MNIAIVFQGSMAAGLLVLACKVCAVGMALVNHLP